MTRKKFIKTLMGEGMSRNDATVCASLARAAARPYLLASSDLLCFCRPHFGTTEAWWKFLSVIWQRRQGEPVDIMDYPLGGAMA